MSKNPCNEIKLRQADQCNLGYLCTACEEQVVGLPNGICGRCMKTAQYKLNTPTDTTVGVLLDSQFYCLDCASWWPDRGTNVMRWKIGRHAQVCACCRRVIVEGAMPQNALSCDKCRPILLGF